MYQVNYFYHKGKHSSSQKHIFLNQNIFSNIQPAQLEMLTLLFNIHLKLCLLVGIQARIQMGGGEVQPTPFCANFIKKSPKLANKILWASPRTPWAPLFSNPGSASGIFVCYITTSALYNIPWFTHPIRTYPT